METIVNYYILRPLTYNNIKNKWNYLQWPDYSSWSDASKNNKKKEASTEAEREQEWDNLYMTLYKMKMRVVKVIVKTKMMTMFRNLYLLGEGVIM